MNYTELPVYRQKEKILDCLKDHSVIIVQSPTGSGKTTCTTPATEKTVLSASRSRGESPPSLSVTSLPVS